MPNPSLSKWFHEIAERIDAHATSFDKKLTDSREFNFAFGADCAAFQQLLASNPQLSAALVAAMRLELEQFALEIMTGLDGATAMSDGGLPIVVSDQDRNELSGILASSFLELTCSPNPDPCL
ncbi:MAG: hypothetical protein J0L78_15675 [Planctomycetes bacterium]|nr:hypothetical protein [Planctomycetota bacterium]